MSSSLTTSTWTPYAYGTSLTVGSAVNESVMKSVVQASGGGSVNDFISLKFVHVPGTGLAFYQKTFSASSYTYMGTTASPGTGSDGTAAHGFTITVVNNGTAESIVFGYQSMWLFNTAGY